MNHTTKKKIARDKEALAKTLRYLLEDRDGQPTAVAMAAKALHIRTTVMGQRMTRLVARGQVQRLGRGFYSAVPSGPATRAALQDLLTHLKKEREQLDAKIVRVQEALDIHEEWIKGK